MKMDIEVRMFMADRRAQGLSSERLCTDLSLMLVFAAEVSALSSLQPSGGGTHDC